MTDISNKRLVLHTGLPKTGTTSIQNTFFRCRKFLLRHHGTLYPELNENMTTPLATIFQENPADHITNKMNGIKGHEEIQKLQKQYLDAVEQEFAQKNWSTLIISAEGLSNHSADSLKSLLDWITSYVARWKVMIVIREPISYTGSVIQQHLKGGETLEELFTSPPLPSFRGRISNAMKAFGSGNLDVYRFEDAVSTSIGVVGTFAKHAGLPDSAISHLNEAAVVQNESLSLKAALILDSLNRHRPFFKNGERSKQRHGRELIYLEQIKGQKFDIPLEVKDRIAQACGDDIEWLHQTRKIEPYQSSSLASESSWDDAEQHSKIAHWAEELGELMFSPDQEELGARFVQKVSTDSLLSDN